VVYYWQVRAVNGGGSTEANGGTWWSFATLPGNFGKSSPANGATNVSVNPTLTWGASAGATEYEYCLDTTSGTSCDGTWISAGSNLSVSLSGLANGATYYWQVRAVLLGGYTYANSNTWRSFTTATAVLPGAFSKSSPVDAAGGQSTAPTLRWNTSSGASSYEYCIDTTNNNTCDGSWLSTGTSTSKALTGLARGVVYYWQVRAMNSGGSTEANAGTWWSFATLPGNFGKSSPANAATNVSVNPTLTWGASAGATEYEYCLDTTSGTTCDGTWTSAGSNLSVSLSGLANGATYYWQVRAVLLGGYTYANSNAWRSFTTVP
jgi:hypothetical protein